ncbi:hypothetical protein AB0J63_26415 [Streptosporangium canum]|uniref:hypothetical protein n=1 Tax=Streptosporangium canum TaxID=324952 RepID=UPI003430308A
MDDATQGGIIFAAIVIVIVALWLWDRHRHPKTRCRTCVATGRLNSSWSARWRDCPDCKGGVRDRRDK